MPNFNNAPDTIALLQTVNPFGHLPNGPFFSIFDDLNLSEVVHKRLLAVLGGFLLMIMQPLLAQKEGAVWYFGNHAGLDFNLQYPKPLTDGQIDTREGVATICDKDGKLLFYTDGQTIYNKHHVVMDNGDGLLGDASSTQSSIVVPRPGSTTQYYVFTVDKAGTPSNPGNGLNYSIVDISLNGGSGSVFQKNIKLINNSSVLFTEKITVVKHKDGESYWVIAHEFGTWVFYTFLLNKTGITLHDQVGAGSEHKFDPDDRDNRGATGYLKSSPKGDYLAAAIEGLHFFELFSFNNASGDISLLAKLPAGNTQNPYAEVSNAYGVEFSPTSNFLYGSTRKGGLLYQWSLENANPLDIVRSVKILRDNPSTLCGALQLAFNGKIYVSLGGQPYLGVINSPIQEACNYIEHGASLIDNSTQTGGKGYFGLPTFLSDFFKAAEFYFENTCYLDKTIFYPSTRIGVDGPPLFTIYKNGVYVGQAETDPVTWQGTFTFPAPGVYEVRMRITQFGSMIEPKREITINQLPELNFPDTTSLCKGSAARLDAGDGAFYSWLDNPNLNVERYRNIFNPGRYVVRVTHYNGCSNSDTTVVIQKPLPLIRDTVISPAACGSSNGSITMEMEKALSAYTFEWTGYPDNHTNRAIGLPGGFYEVKITDTGTGCTLLSKLSISEENAPEVTIMPSIPGTVCPGAKLTLTATGAANYLWDNPSGNTTASVEVAPWTTTTYRVKGFSVDPETQKECSDYSEITINVYNYALPQLGADRVGCEGDTIKLDGGSTFSAWNWSNGASTRVIEITRSEPELILYATFNDRCVLSDTIGIVVKPLPKVDLGEDINLCKGSPVELSGGTGDSYSWSTGDTVQAIRVTYSDLFILSIRKNGCSSSDSVLVTLRDLPEVNLGRDTTVCVSEPVTLYGGRGDSYLWSTNETTREIQATETGSYRLTISLDGCTNSDTINLTIRPLPEVDLGKDSIFCKSNPIVLSGGTGDSYLWNTGSVTQRLTVETTGEYSLQITKDGCSASDTVNIQVNDPSLLIIDSVNTSQVTCPGMRDGSLRIYVHGTGNDYEYSVDNGDSWSESPVFQGLYGENDFRVVVREDKVCTVRYNQSITFAEPDSIRIRSRLLSPSCETCPDGEIRLVVGGGTAPYSILWSTMDTVLLLRNMAMGKYLVWVTDAAGCRQNALIDLNMDYPPFQIPNAFTPNGDAFNETWKLPSLRDFPEATVQVFDRTGRLVWRSEPGYPVAWDGRDLTGRMLPMGAYYYLILLEAEMKPLKGSVSILK
jgi:gliding motility-associated-like protein